LFRPTFKAVQADVTLNVNGVPLVLVIGLAGITVSLSQGTLGEATVKAAEPLSTERLAEAWGTIPEDAVAHAWPTMHERLIVVVDALNVTAPK